MPKGGELGLWSESVSLARQKENYCLSPFRSWQSRQRDQGRATQAMVAMAPAPSSHLVSQQRVSGWKIRWKLYILTFFVIATFPYAFILKTFC